MLKKIDETIAITLLPLKDLFFEKDLFLSYLKENNYNKIKKEIYNKLLKEVKIKSYDEVDLLLRKIHSEIFDKKEDYFDLEEYYFEIINKLSEGFYSIRDGKLVYKYWANSEKKLFGPYDEGNKIEIFRRINKKFSMDILAMNHILNNPNAELISLNENYSNIELADLQLDDILSKGLSENHIHGNASLSFSLSWQILMYNNISKKEINSLNITEYDSNLFKDNPYVYVKLAELIRNLIIVFLKCKKKDDIYGFKSYFLQKNKDEEENSKEIVIYEPILYLESILNGNYIDEKSILYYLEKINKDFNVVREDKIGDLINIMFKDEVVDTYSENIFLFKCLEYRKKIKCSRHNKEDKDTFFNKLFLYYLRIKNQFYLNLVQSNEVKGLDNFQNFFVSGTSITGHARLTDKEYYKLIIKSVFQDKYLKNIEFRFSFARKENYLRKNIRDFLTAYKEVIDEYYTYRDEILDFPKVGLIFHLIKKEDYNPKGKCIYKFYKTEQIDSLYYEEVIKEYKQNIESLLEIRNLIPELSYFILGIDSANLENNAPTEVFAPVYEYARDSKRDVLKARSNTRDIINTKSLRFTYHAGEDFRHLISGLRRIHEVVDQCKFHSGDRIGHGTALGINSDKWCEENPVIVIPRIEHLNNLLWVWDIYSSSTNSNPKIALYLEKEIYKVTKEIYIQNTGITTPMLYENYKRGFKSFKDVYVKEHLYMFSKGNEEQLYNKIFCIKSKEKIQVWDEDKLYYSKHCKCYLDNMYEPIFVEVNELDKEIIKEVQAIVLKYISRKGIVIEINPSSNMSIGEMDTIFDHYAFNINNVNDIKGDNVMMTINTDDPMVFNTTLSNEYAYIYYGLAKKGYSKESILKWIDKIREHSMDSTFIDKTLTNKQYYDYLKAALDKL